MNATGAIQDHIPEKFDPAEVRNLFPALAREVYGKPLVYLDNAASSQKPQAVIDRLVRYYSSEHSNVHRGVHLLSREATDAYEAARKRVVAFINAPSEPEVLYTRGTTEGINLVASSFGPLHVGKGDVVLVSHMEHHSNIVPWQMLCEAQGARVRAIPVSDTGEIIYEEFERLLSERVRLLAIAHVSNTLGTINPLKRMIRHAHDMGVPVVVDGAQAAPHMKIDVQELDCDFYAFSSHKMFGPTGIGILYAKAEHLETMPPWQGGGDMIETVAFEKTTYNDPPHKFEAGTPNIADVLGFASAIDFLEGVGQNRVAAYEQDLLAYATERLSEIEGVRLIGTATDKASVLSFLIGDIHPYDAGTILDRLGIAVRTGHHCTQPLMRRFDIPGTVRASFALYNTFDEVDALAAGVRRVKEMLG
ncbi:MAG: cysteine desulfurase [Bacteroidetes bacterium SB0662_bin_6]|nr:cysteine desulfurase [Bacteroidetes bacterium SB0668_bin_1]MYE05482.1 cysteine desulfurase [Bacteroidetes bacterium SB0662_bin_6]